MVWRKMVCDKVVCEGWCGERWCVTKWCVKDGVLKDGVETLIDEASPRNPEMQAQDPIGQVTQGSSTEPARALLVALDKLLCLSVLTSSYLFLLKVCKWL